MTGRSARLNWLSRFLFWLLLFVSACLIALVVFCPLVDDGSGTLPVGWRRIVAVFARDGTVRKTAVASAIGLTVTACVFFRDGAPPRPTARKAETVPPPPGIAGA